MADDITRIDLVDVELNSGKLNRSWIGNVANIDDVEANGFGVRLFRDGKPVNVIGAQVRGYFRNSAGETITINGDDYGYFGDYEVYIVLPAACYATPGIFSLAIKLIGGGVTETVRIVDGTIINTIY